MPRQKKPEIMKKEIMALCLPKHIVDRLKLMPNRSELVTELLHVHIDRLADGSIQNMIDARRTDIHNMIVECLKEDKSLVEENVKLVQDIKAAVDSLKETSIMAGKTKSDMKVIYDKLTTLVDELSNVDLAKKYTESVVAQMYSKTEDMARAEMSTSGRGDSDDE